MIRSTFLLGAFILVTTSCAQKQIPSIDNFQKYGTLTNGFPLHSIAGTLYFENGIIKATGSFAESTAKETSQLKTGLWKEYYQNGTLRHEGTYQIGSYLNCGVVGLLTEYYHYKVGHWKYFNEKGELEFEVDFTPSTLHVETSCEGGDSLTFGLIKTVPIKYSNQLPPDKIYELQKETMVEDGFTTITYTPLNGRLFIIYDFQN
ncbi:toxin-antitoxin system YwqK family antitoxin [Rufibacter tibetensis]|uniref:MORN repeat variant n=1 Tax=Rufibacter tibetensis TaxID=512763 RepID=A0A0P0CAJ6_9BACT|nr:hypothetical protein [Rufibacter tibetensis]ALI98551.1 hypothetical protein DC20_05680 [Rufibacter tibetensis]